MKQRGFTLLEMVVAIALFAVVAAISYTGLDRFLSTRDLITERLHALRDLQLTMSLLETDFRYLSNRPVRNGFGDPEPGLVALPAIPLGPGELLRLTTGQPRPGLQPGQLLQRVAWRLNEGHLERVSWRVLDRDQDSAEYRREVLSRVADIQFRYLVRVEEDRIETRTEWSETELLPAAVELVVTLDNGREYRRVLEIAGGA